MFESNRLRFPTLSSTNNTSTNKQPPTLSIRPSNSTHRLGTPTIALPTNSVSFPRTISKPSPSSSSLINNHNNTTSTTVSTLQCNFNVSPNNNQVMIQPGFNPSPSSLSSSVNSLRARSLSKPSMFQSINNNNTITIEQPGSSNIVQNSMSGTNSFGNHLGLSVATETCASSLSSSPQSFGLMASSSFSSVSPSNSNNNNNGSASLFSVYSSPSSGCTSLGGFPPVSSPPNSVSPLVTMSSENNTLSQQQSVEERVIVDFEEFEAAKENIIPLKGGRKATDLRRIFGKQPLQEIKPLQPIMLPGSVGVVQSSIQSPPSICTNSTFNPLLSSSNNVNACSTPMSPTGMFSPTTLGNTSFNGFNTLIPPPAAVGEDDCAMTDVSPMPQQQNGKTIFNFSNLTKSKVCFDNHNMRPKLSVERKQFEKRIASLSNHLDPITVWLEYVDWIEKSYPTLSKASQYVPTLQACTKFVLANQQLLERYRNDERYLEVWLKYADQCLDPIDVFTFLETKKICLNHSELYIRWATLLEDRKDLKAADAVLEQGINRGAQPAKSLQTFHTGVKARFMKSILNRTTSNPSSVATGTFGGNNMTPVPPLQNGGGTSSVENNQRLPFNSLSKKPTAIRPTGAFRPGPPLPSMKPTKMKSNNASLSQKNSPINNFVIYDESNGSAEKIAHAASTRTLPFQIPKELTSMGPRFLTGEQEQEKENNEKPDKWTNYSVPQNTDDMMLGMLPIGASTAKPVSHFAIFVDEEFK